GTGVGGGLVLNGKSITGHSYITGEFGHIRLPVDALEVVGRDFPLLRCGCGQRYLAAANVKSILHFSNSSYVVSQADDDDKLLATQ
ncbi:ROK family protein, partial [Enterobacter kobei]